MTDRRKVLGIIGGMGSVAAAHFFQRLVALTPASRDQDYLEVVLHNNNHVPDRTAALLGHGTDPRPELLRSCRLLDEAGADVIVIACITSHAFLPDLAAATRATIVDGIAETAAYCRRTWPERRRAGILATTGSLESGIFHRALAAAGLESLNFTGPDQTHHFMEAVYSEWGVKAGHTGGQARERLVGAGRELVARGAELVIAGCTEVPVVVHPEDLPVPLVDVTDILVRRAIELCHPDGAAGS
ncbi:MAG TPA: amino acid racemase [Candidatus Krumholzibacteria bacterium]|nr:amino acid racemase [Candidatus Krumholzibacteria bacterium]HPD72035.1 amino acid racemase [Candidatus Krumholzibacteria bacterium]HRY41032.1 amino acid racemase [Candidatus Krumholzibacteria bacterium]